VIPGVLPPTERIGGNRSKAVYDGFRERTSHSPGNPFAQDVFAMGISILEKRGVTTAAQCCNVTTGNYHYIDSAKLLAHLPQDTAFKALPPAERELLTEMIAVNPARRPTTVEAVTRYRELYPDAL